MLQKFYSMFKMGKRAKELPGLTEYLVNSPMFRKLALKIHEEKQEAVEDIKETMEKMDDKLEEKLLTKDMKAAVDNAQQIKKMEKTGQLGKDSSIDQSKNNNRQ